MYLLRGYAVLRQGIDIIEVVHHVEIPSRRHCCYVWIGCFVDLRFWRNLLPLHPRAFG